MFVATVCFPGFEASLIFLIKPSFRITKTRQKFNISRRKRAFKVK